MTTHTLFPQLVKLNEENHKYTDDYGQEYMGFSRFGGLLGMNDFEGKKDLIAGVTAKSEGVDKSIVIDRWEQQRDLGSRIDKALELSAMFGHVPEEYDDIKTLIEGVLAEYEQFGKNTYEQLIVHNTYYKIAGAIDKCCFTSARKDSSFELTDFKCFNKGISDMYLGRGWLAAPFNHMSKTKYIKTVWQLSYYAWQLEELMQKRCRGLWIHLIDTANNTHQKIPVPYIKNDIIIALETHKDAIIEMTNKREETIF
jgi:hypothetical protein